jgi:hypothetical protein
MRKSWVIGLLSTSLLFALSTCSDIPDEEVERVTATVEVSDSKNARTLSRSSAFTPSTGDTAIAYLIEDTPIDNVSSIDSILGSALTSSNYSFQSGSFAGSVTMTVPTYTDVRVLMIFSNAGEKVGGAVTSAFSITNEDEVNVKIEGSGSFTDNSTGTDDNPPSVDNSTSTDNSSVDNSTQQSPTLDLSIDFNFDGTSQSLSGVLDNSSVTGISADFTTNYSSTITTTGAVKFEGDPIKLSVRYFGTYYPQIEISTDKEISFEGLSFDHYHNHNSCCGSYLGYDVNIYLDNSIDNLSVASFRAESSTSGVRDNLTLSSSGNFYTPGNYTLRWTPSGLYNGRTSTDGDYIVVDKISLSLKYKP